MITVDKLMISVATSYNHFRIVFSITISLSLLSSVALADLSSYRDHYGPVENISTDPVDFDYSRTEDSFQTRLKSQLRKDVFNDDDDAFGVDLNMEYGNLFDPSPDGYMGFAYFSAGLDDDRQLNILTSIGHYVDALDGDILFSYRLIKDERNYTFTNLGEVGDRIYENSFAASYKRYSSNFFLRETSLSYSLSSITGEEFFATGGGSGAGGDSSTSLLGGYGDTMTHEVGAKLAFGYEGLGQGGFVTGLKTSLGFGYEYAIQDEFYDYTQEVEESVSLLAAMQQKTVFGLFNTSYKYLDSSQTLSAGYSLRGIDFYLQGIRYEDGSDNKLLGLRIKLNLLNFRDPFQKISKLFGNSSRTARGHELIRHHAHLSSNTLATLPAFRDITSF